MTANASTEWKPIKASSSAMRLTNPIRDIVDQLKLPNPPPKPLIALSIGKTWCLILNQGDPTVYGNFDNSENINEALIQNIKSRKYNGYGHSAGIIDARKAIAKKFSRPESPLTFENVVVTSGCSGALELCFGVLANSDQNVLLPAPGFSIYETICQHKGIEARFYRLLPEKGWEADLSHMESLIDGKTAAILVNNPSNPCGSVYSKSHLQAILQVAEKHHLPIIADEIYADMVFEGHTFHPIASLTTSVPVLSVGGMAKIYLVPGWRVGWVLIHDRHDLFQEVKVGLIKLSQLILGANTLVQSVVEEALFHTPSEYYDSLYSSLSSNALFLSERLSRIPGLKVVQPGGAMYLMFGINLDEFKNFSNDVEFAKALLTEEMVFVLPGTIFRCPNFIRLVICPPQDKLSEACDRIAAFCQRHHK